MKKAVALLAVLLCATPVSAAPAKKVGGWLKRNWVPLTASALLTLARAANTESSINCQKQPGCVEGNSILGKHPSPTATRLFGYGSAALLDTANFTWWWATNKYDSKDLRPLMLLWNAPLIIVDGFDTQNNVNSAEYLQKHPIAMPKLPHYR